MRNLLVFSHLLEYFWRDKITTMALEKELATYQAKLPELKQHEGKFVLIHGDQVVDTFSSYDDALKEGYKQFSLEPFLVKQILAIEPVFCFTRPIAPVRAS
jgi:hypothetical protein